MNNSGTSCSSIDKIFAIVYKKNVQTLAKMKDDDTILIEFQEIHCNYSHYLVIIHGGLLYVQRKRKEDATNISLFDFNADDIW